MAPDIGNHAFIDGYYLCCAYERTLQKVFPEAHYRNISFEKIKDDLRASKVFYARNPRARVLRGDVSR